MSEEYDVQQVCENGHQITDCYNINPEKRKKFCQECGEKTITECPNCCKAIQGGRLTKSYPGILASAKGAPTGEGFDSHLMSAECAVVPSYCQNCGEPYPWTQRKIVAAIQVLAEFGNLNEEEKKTIEQDIENIAKDVPEAELSARRIKRIWDKCSRAGYEVIIELASSTIAKILKDQ